MTSANQELNRIRYQPVMVQNYTDYRLYIHEALQVMGSSASRLSETLGLSRSMMSHILKGLRKLNPTLVGAVGDYFHLDQTGKSLLAAMVDLDNDSRRARRTAWAALKAHQRYLAADRPSIAQIEALSEWWTCAIYELASMKSFRPDPAWIADTLMPRITIKQAQKSLKKLLAADMLAPNESGGLSRVEELAWSEAVLPPGAASDAVRKLYGGLNKLSGTSMDRFDVDVRHQSCSMFSVSESRFEEVKIRLRELEREVFHLATSPAKDSDDRVLSLVINLFPVAMPAND